MCETKKEISASQFVKQEQQVPVLTQSRAFSHLNLRKKAPQINIRRNKSRDLNKYIFDE